MKDNLQNRLRHGRIISMISLAVVLFAGLSHPALAFTTGESASLVIGQSSFTSNTCTTTQSGLCGPIGVAFDSSGNLWISDLFNGRVLEFTPPFANGELASLVIGQSSFTTKTCFPVTQSGLCRPRGLAFDSFGDLWVADPGLSRVLEFTPPFANGELAHVVIGQSSFTTNTCATTQSGLCGPDGVAFDSSGNLWISDLLSARVLEFAPQFPPSFSNGESASLVIGQPSFTTNTCSLTQSGLCEPNSLAFDSSGHLWVGDGFYNRTLEFNPPFATGELASLVIGQSSFTSNTCTTTQSGLCSPQGLAFDSSGNLWISDQINSRLLEFSPPFLNGELASLVIGQSSFTTKTCATTQSGLCGPLGLAFDSPGNLWVADGANNRVLEFRPPDFAVSAALSSLSLVRGSSVTFTITMASIGSFSGPVTLSATITPMTQFTPTVSLSPIGLVLFPGSSVSSMLTISTAHSPKGDGTYTVTVTATSGSLSHTVILDITVTKT